MTFDYRFAFKQAPRNVRVTLFFSDPRRSCGCSFRKGTVMTIQRIEVEPERCSGNWARLSAEELDALPFGAHRARFRGQVLSYNQAEERLAGRKREDVVGQELLPRHRPVYPRAAVLRRVPDRRGARKLNEVFDFTFRFPRAIARCASG